MVLVKGVEIIPKRDKVTFATNIFGKWEDYSIDTPQGKALKEAVERYKELIKRGAQVSESSIEALKQQMTVEPQPSEPVDFWAAPQVEHKKIESSVTKEPELVVESVQEAASLFDNFDTEIGDDDSLVVIHAYVKNGRQHYLSGWDDCSDWMLSVVPFPITRSKGKRLINKAVKQIEEANKTATIRSRFPKDLKFKMVPYVDNCTEELTPEQIRKQAEEMIAAHRASKNK